MRKDHYLLDNLRDHVSRLVPEQTSSSKQITRYYSGLLKDSGKTPSDVYDMHANCARSVKRQKDDIM